MLTLDPYVYLYGARLTALGFDEKSPVAKLSNAEFSIYPKSEGPTEGEDEVYASNTGLGIWKGRIGEIEARVYWKAADNPVGTVEQLLYGTDDLSGLMGPDPMPSVLRQDQPSIDYTYNTEGSGEQIESTRILTITFSIFWRA